MNLSSARATFGLNCRATASTPAASGTTQVGPSNESIALSNATKIISFDAVTVGDAYGVVVDISDLDGTGSSAWTAGTHQVETNTVTSASGITGNGNAQIIITCDGMTGSPKTINVPVTTTAHTTATLIATALRAAAAADTDVSAKLTIGGTGADITATVKPTSTYTVNGTNIPVYPANDTTLNIAIQNGTCTGITTAATSSGTVTGVATQGCYAPDLDGTDFEGVATGGSTSIYGIHIKNHSISSTPVIFSTLTALELIIAPGNCFQYGGDAALAGIGDLQIISDNFGDKSAHITVTIAGS